MALSAEQPFVLRAHPLAWDDAAEMDRLVEMAERSGVVAWCFHRLLQQEGLAQELLLLAERMKKRYMAILIDNQQRLRLYHHLKQLFDAHDIPFVLLKGMALAFTVYPDEALRPMGDLDLLVPPKDVLRARDLLLQEGARSSHVPMSDWHELHNAHVRAMVLPPFKYLIEIHSKLYATGSPYLPKARRWQELATEKQGSMGTFPVLREAWLLYHLCTHLYYGYQMGGLRLGWLVDVARVLEQAEDAAALVEETLALHKPARKALVRTLGWVQPLTSTGVQRALEAWRVEFVDFPSLGIFMSAKGEEDLHRLIVLRNLWHTPGLKNKLLGLWYQLFPSEAYMRHYFGEGPWWRRHLKRWGWS